MKLNIISINIPSNTISVLGDYTTPLYTGIKFLLYNGNVAVPSIAQDGLWTVVSSTVNGPNTDIVLNETMSLAFTATDLVSAIYEINFTDTAIAPFFIQPETVNGPGQTHQNTSLALNGKGTLNYGENLLENMIHIMEHFASATPPDVPTIGQVWFDTSIPQFNYWTGGAWTPLLPTPPIQDELYDLFAATTGVPASSAELCRFVIGRNSIFDFSVDGSAAIAEVAATATTIFSVQQNNGEFGTITFDPGSTVGYFTGYANCTINDKISIVAPAVPDATLADLTFTLGGIINLVPLA